MNVKIRDLLDEAGVTGEIYSKITTAIDEHVDLVYEDALEEIEERTEEAYSHGYHRGHTDTLENKK